MWRPPARGDTSARTGFCHSGPRSLETYVPRGLSGAPTTRERELADRVDDRVPPTPESREVGGQAVDDLVGAKVARELDVPRVHDGGHVGAQDLRQLERGRADGARGPVDDDPAAGSHLRRAQEHQSQDHAVADRGRLVEGQVGRHERDRGLLGQAQVLRVRSKLVGVDAEHAVAGREPLDIRTDLRHDAGELGAQHGVPWAQPAGEESRDPRAGAAQPAVGAVHGGRMDTHENVTRPGHGARDLA